MDVRNLQIGQRVKHGVRQTTVHGFYTGTCGRTMVQVYVQHAGQDGVLCQNVPIDELEEVRETSEANA